MDYEDVIASLFQVPLEQFVTERKRLAGELKTAGDKPGAAKLIKLPRPPTSAWVVDQLWWQHRAAFDALFDTAQRLRDGQLDAMPAHREAIAKLRAHAAKVLSAAEHGASEATLRRVTQTVSALAATGGWDPDLPGALSADRDPPGFEAIGVSNVIAFSAPSHAPNQGAALAHAAPAAPEADHADGRARVRRDAAETKRRAEHEAAAARAEAAAEQRRVEAARAKAAADRHRLEAALRTAHGDVTSREREVARLERELVAARQLVTLAKAVVYGLEARLAEVAQVE